MTILFILIIILFFDAFIAIYEFGHFTAAKILEVRVEEFAIGTGLKLLSRTRGETTYSLRALPIGGFCSMEGEEETPDDPRSLSGRPVWRKLIILTAGAFLNFVTGLVILPAFFSAAGSLSVSVVSGYLPGAEDIQETGLLPGDEFCRIGGHRIYFQSDAILFLGRAGENVAVEVLQDGRRPDLGTPYLPYCTLIDESGQQSLKRGVMVGELREVGFLDTLYNAWYQSIDYVRTVWLSLGDLIRGVVSLSDMAGPIGILVMAGEVGQQGVAAAEMAGALFNIFSLAALIAINLVMMNLLPILVLDSGQILFLPVGGIYHFLIRRRISQKYLGYINTAGFFCFIALTAVVAVSDVNKLIL